MSEADQTQKKKTDKAQTAAPAKPDISALTPDEFQFREYAPFTQALRLALGHQVFAEKPPKAFHAAEVGVYRGRSLAVLLEAAAGSPASIKWKAFDTFSGMPPLSGKDLELAPENASYRTRQEFADTSLREVKAFLAPFPGVDAVEFIAGDISETLPAQPEQKYLFVNIAVKTYEAHRIAFEYFYPRMLKGGVVLFSDFYNRAYPMAEAAVRDMIEETGEPLYMLHCGEGHASFRRSFLVKE